MTRVDDKQGAWKLRDSSVYPLNQIGTAHARRNLLIENHSFATACGLLQCFDQGVGGLVGEGIECPEIDSTFFLIPGVRFGIDHGLPSRIQYHAIAGIDTFCFQEPQQLAPKKISTNYSDSLDALHTEIG